ncbi:MAG: hypothetical protein KF861_22450, partial [Planctomycetaceae bacterium]|nr:hypothetical protein [Planctomycetaceae bacterium]
TSLLMKGSADVQDYPGRNEVFQFVAVEVTGLTFNDDIEDGIFDTSLPVGTVVNDQILQKHYMIGKKGDHVHLTRDDLFKIRSAATHRFSWQRLSLRAKILSVAIGLFLAAAAVKLYGRIVGGAEKVGRPQDVDDARPG